MLYKAGSRTHPPRLASRRGGALPAQWRRPREVRKELPDQWEGRAVRMAAVVDAAAVRKWAGVTGTLIGFEVRIANDRCYKCDNNVQVRRLACSALLNMEQVAQFYLSKNLTDQFVVRTKLKHVYVYGMGSVEKLFGPLPLLISVMAPIAGNIYHYHHLNGWRSTTMFDIYQSESIFNSLDEQSLWKSRFKVSVYASKGPARKALLLKQLILHKMCEGGDVKDHVNKFSDTVDRLSGMDIEGVTQSNLSWLRSHENRAGPELAPEHLSGAPGHVRGDLIERPR
ncbi:hypothetical protein EVAR_50719_1 [Eumeta japonica]|uniref:Retrovirus-related Pol polyprotein from transposon TNT 1-94 n=1 Tax=Eumeta variegata TaxID=151549 RepID=A0A4C1YM94_EUMVA|nr:hypothetical protein EVAR_50719_1 [Eumeta japonica]